MARAKNMNLFLLDGTARGRIKCTLANWTGVAYKIPRNMLKDSRSIALLNQTGVYLLFGDSGDTGEPLVYVGQAGIRKNGKGILCRLDEHVLQTKKDWWNTAVAFTTQNNSFGPTEISYLENRFYHLALDAKRFKAENDTDPNPGNLTEEKESELEEYIDYARLVIGALGFPVFEPIRQEEMPGDSSTNENIILYCRRSGAMAEGQRTSEGFVVFKGSKLRDERQFTPSCPPNAFRNRAKYKQYINSDNVLLADILFSSSSNAANFVTGANCNGNREWKTKDGVTLGQIESSEQNS